MTNDLRPLDNVRTVRSNHLPLSTSAQKDTPISLVYGSQGTVNMVTLYPKESVAIFSGSGYFGIHKGVPIGFAEAAHCVLSWEFGS